MTNTQQIPSVALGKSGLRVSRIGLGAMGMSGVYGDSDENDSIATIHAALDAGVDLIDPGDFYGFGHNEMLIGRPLREVDREKVLLSIKSGGLRTPDGGWTGFDSRPDAVENTSSPTVCSHSVSTTSTSTGPPASIRASRSRTPSV